MAVFAVLPQIYRCLVVTQFTPIVILRRAPSPMFILSKSRLFFQPGRIEGCPYVRRLLRMNNTFSNEKIKMSHYLQIGVSPTQTSNNFISRDI